jgi:hypothetical protein
MILIAWKALNCLQMTHRLWVVDTSSVRCTYPWYLRIFLFFSLPLPVWRERKTIQIPRSVVVWGSSKCSRPPSRKPRPPTTSPLVLGHGVRTSTTTQRGVSWQPVRVEPGSGGACMRLRAQLHPAILTNCLSFVRDRSPPPFPKANARLTSHHVYSPTNERNRLTMLT